MFRATITFILFFSFQLTVQTAEAQSIAANAGNPVPTPGVGHDYINALQESVDPASGQVSLRLSVPIPPGRGLTLPFAIAYDSSSVNYAGQSTLLTQPPYSGTFFTNWSPIQTGGWSYTIPSVTNNMMTRRILNSLGQTVPCQQFTGYVFQDPTGGSHNLRLGYIPPSDPCNVASLYTDGGDDIVTAHGSPGPVLVHEQDGTVYSFAGSTGNWSVGAGINYISIPAWVEDTNGNKITTAASIQPSSFLQSYSVTDTTGRTALSVSGFGATGNTISVSGLSSPYTLTWGTVTVSGFAVTSKPPDSGWDVSGCGGIGGVAQKNQSVVSAITLPNNQKYTFTYDSKYGELAKIQYPSGGYVSYSWGLNPQSAFVRYQGCGYIYDKPAILHRYVSFDGTNIALQQDFQYPPTTWYSGNNDWQWQSKQTIVTTTVKNPDGTSNVYTTKYTYLPYTPSPFTNIPPGYDEGPGMGSNSITNGDSDTQIPLESTIVYQGPSGTLRTVTKTWADQFRLTSEQTTLDNGQTSKVAYSYGTGMQVTEKDEYDFGSGAPGNLLRKTLTSYQSFPATPLYPAAASIFNKPCQKIIYDGIGNRVAETDYYYDNQATLCGAAGTPLVSAVSSVSGHDETNYSPTCPVSNCPRGNLTKQTAWLNTTGTPPSVAYTYDETGQKLTSLDALQNTTTYTYSDSYTDTPPSTQTNAYVTKITYPSTGGTSHIVSFSYAYSDGKMTVSTDENGQQTKSYYNDSLRRLTETDYPGGGKTTISYNDAPPQPSVTTSTLITSGTSLTTVHIMDGMGHTIQSQITSDPDGADYSDTTYDGLGRVYTRSNPHRAASAPTDGKTTYAYDALGRNTGVLRPDGSDVDISYVGNCVTIADEAGKLKKSCSDGLGRVTEVDEPGAGATYGSAGGGTVTVGGSEQNGPGQPGHATATITNDAGCYVNGPSYSPESGSVRIVVNGVTVGTGWSGSCNGSTETLSPTFDQIVANLASSLTSNSLAGVNASVTGTCVWNSKSCSITITAKTYGSNTNYPLSSSYLVNCPGLSSCPGGSGIIPSTPSSLAGGTDSTPDYGTLTITVNGTTETVTYGSGSTAQQLAGSLAAAFANDSDVSISQNGTSLNFAALDVGADSNYSVSTSVTWNSALLASPSFTACLQSAVCSSGTSNGTLTGGTDPTWGSAPLVTLYTYDTLDNLTCVVQKGTDTTAFSSCASAPATWRPRSFVYDSLSRLTSATNPESGTTTYSYDANGNLATKIGPRPSTTSGSLTTNYAYDALNRLTKRSYVSASTQPAMYGYDGVALTGCNTGNPSLPSPTYLIGRRSEMCAGPSHSLFSYDPMGRVVAESRKQVAAPSAFTKNTAYTYFLDGELKTLTYPSGDVVTYTASPAGRITNVSDPSNNFVAPPSSGVMYTPNGALAQMMQGSGITTNNSYNNRLQPVVLTAGTTSTNFLSLTYDFHLGGADNGNVFQIINNLDSTRSTAFQYDALNRIQQANTITTTSANCWGEVYAIDAWGNLTNRSGPSGMAGCGTEGLSVTASTKNQLSGLTYDAAGDVTNDGNGNTPTYDAEARIATVAGVTYDYDANGLRVRKNPGGLYWPDANGNVLAESDLTGTINEEYIFFNGRRIARVDRPSGNVHYYFSDHLGSATVITDPTGIVQAHYYYYPYGGLQSSVGSDSTHYLFTGKERDGESGLDNFELRYYGSSLGRFTSVDPMAMTGSAAAIPDPQSWNAYAYVRNNPLNLVDPTGAVWCSDSLKSCITDQQYTALQRAKNDAWLLYTRHVVDDKAAGLSEAEAVLLATSLSMYLRGDVQKAEKGLDLFNSTLGFGSSSCAGGGSCADAVSMAIGSVVAGVFSDGLSEEGAAARESVYVYRILENGKTVYVGITNDLERRALEHGAQLQEILRDLSRGDARAAEQRLIEEFGLEKNGGTLRNKINSISPRRGEFFDNAIQRGEELLRGVGFDLRDPI